MPQPSHRAYRRAVAITAGKRAARIRNLDQTQLAVRFFLLTNGALPRRANPTRTTHPQRTSDARTPTVLHCWSTAP
jgi:hypothetical protein